MFLALAFTGEALGRLSTGPGLTHRVALDRLDVLDVLVIEATQRGPPRSTTSRP